MSDATLAFLKAATGSESDNLIDSLLKALKQDGYKLAVDAPQYLRKLQEEGHTAEPGSTDYTISVVLVTICVICAGCASGLTQVLSETFYGMMLIC